MTECELEALKQIERTLAGQMTGTATAKLTALIERGVTEGEGQRRHLHTLMRAGYEWVWRFFPKGSDIADPAELKRFNRYCIDVEKERQP